MNNAYTIGQIKSHQPKAAVLRETTASPSVTESNGSHWASEVIRRWLGDVLTSGNLARVWISVIEHLQNPESVRDEEGRRIRKPSPPITNDL